MLSRSTLTGKAARRYLDVTLPADLGGDTARLQSLTEGEKSRYETWLVNKAGKVSADKLDSARRRLLVLALVDEAGGRMFADGDEDTLAEADGAVTSFLFDAAREHCGFARNDIEDAVKNSVRISVAASPSGSPA